MQDDFQNLMRFAAKITIFPRKQKKQRKGLFQG